MFSRSFFVALLSTPLLVLAASPNPFNIPTTGLNATAGQPLDLSWKPTTQGTVTLILRSGTSSNLDDGTVIASNIDNSGSYTWTPDTHITRGSDYTIEIVDDADNTQTNYTPYFVLDSDTVTPYSTSQVTMGATATGSRSASASASGSASSGSVATVSTTVSVSSASGTASSGSSAASASGSSSASGSASQSASATNSDSASSSAAASGSASGSAAAATQSGSGAPRVTAMAGMLGLAALGALAL